MSLENVLQVEQREKTVAALAQEEARYFIHRFIGLTVFLYLGAALALYLFSTTPASGPSFSTGLFVGMSFCTISSFVSFLVTEWAFDQPKMIFMGVAMGSITVRMFNILFAFAVALFFLKLNGTGLVTGMMVSYFSYLVIEILYVHNKGLLRGE